MIDLIATGSRRAESYRFHRAIPSGFPSDRFIRGWGGCHRCHMSESPRHGLPARQVKANAHESSSCPQPTKRRSGGTSKNSSRRITTTPPPARPVCLPGPCLPATVGRCRSSRSPAMNLAEPSSFSRTTRVWGMDQPTRPTSAIAGNRSVTTSASAATSTSPEVRRAPSTKASALRHPPPSSLPTTTSKSG